MSNPAPTGYSGKIVRSFLREVEKYPDTALLDTGLISNENISLLAGRLKQLYIYDFIRRLNSLRDDDLPFDTFLDDMDYPPQTFDGIFLWDFCDYLATEEVHRFLNKCYATLKPGGLIMTYAVGERQPPARINAYIVDISCRVYTRPRSEVALSSRYRSNRRILTLFGLFSLVTSSIYRDGFRGFIFRRDPS